MKCIGYAVSMLLLAGATAGSLAAQAPADQWQAHLVKARTLAGSDFITTEEVQCDELGGESPYRTATDDHGEPTRVFDNLYYVGSRSLGAWAIKTSAGIILVDAMHTKSVQSTLLPAFHKLDLDPAQVKYVIVTHAAGDEYGGATYFQAKYSAQVIMSAADWEFLPRVFARSSGQSRGDTLGGGSPQGRSGRSGGGGGGGGGGRGGFGGRGGGGFGGGRGGGGGGGGGFGRGGGGERGRGASAAIDEKPSQDLTAVDGQTFTLGDETVTVVLTPGDTPGALSVIIPVTDHGQPHVAVVLGGTEIPASHELKQVYIASAERLDSIAAAAHADVELNNYPFVDNAIARLDTLRKAKTPVANPFIITADGLHRFFGVLAECGWVSLLRPDGGRDGDAAGFGRP